MRRVGEFLPAARDGSGDSEPPPPPAPKCARCGDARLLLTHRGGDLTPCPDCRGAVMSLDERARRTGFGRIYELDEWDYSVAMRDAELACRELVDGTRSVLFLRAGIGAGKTKLARIWGCEFMRRGGTAIFWNMPELLDRIRETFDDERGEESQFEFIRRNIYGFGLVILDDLGSVKPTAWSMMITYQIVNHLRNEHEAGHDQRLLVTSNVARGEERDAQGIWIDDRVLSRLSPGEVVIEGAPDRRRDYER